MRRPAYKMIATLRLYLVCVVFLRRTFLVWMFCGGLESERGKVGERDLDIIFLSMMSMRIVLLLLRLVFVRREDWAFWVTLLGFCC